MYRSIIISILLTLCIQKNFSEEILSDREKVFNEISRKYGYDLSKLNLDISEEQIQNFLKILQRKQKFSTEVDPKPTQIEDDRIFCNYFTIDGAYGCQMEIFNPDGRDDFENIEGQHQSNLSNSDVQIVIIDRQTTRIIPSIICREFPNLTELRVINSNVHEFAEASIADCQNLMRLQLTSNPVRELSENLFSKNLRLLQVVIEDASIQELPSKLFHNNLQLTDINLSKNSIQELPNGIFDGLRFLRTISLADNQLSAIKKESFGSSTFNLVFLNANNNRIEFIDRYWFDQARNLEFLHLERNVCLDRTFDWIGRDRESMVELIGNCFDDDGSHIRCTFGGMGPRICMLEINNPNGRDDFTVIEGDFPPGQSNSTITSVYLGFQNTLNIPSIICRQFPSLEEIMILVSRVSILSSQSLEACHNLRNFSLIFNPVTSIPDYFFSQNQNLRFIRIEFSSIKEITPYAFAGLGSNFEFLSLEDNFIENIHRGAFGRLHGIQHINLSANRLRILDFGAFGVSLLTLRSFYAELNFINAIDSAWFDNAWSLDVLGLRVNTCVSMRFENVQNNREFVQGQLARCFNNF